VAKEWLVGSDIGGAFTDIIGVNIKTGEVRRAKVPSTPPLYIDGVINGLKKSGLRGEECLSFRHGATISTNAILERRGAKTALITTKGFRDVLTGGRAERISAFELNWDPPELIVPRRNILEVEERIGPWGEVITPLNEDDVRAAARKCRKRGIESIAVCYMDSFMNPVHEYRTKEILEKELPGVDITISYEVRPEMLEFERTTTTVLNAYVSPVLRRYIALLAKRLKEDWNYEGPLLITTGFGGVVDSEQAVKNPAWTFNSSPISGAMGMAGYVGPLVGFENVLAFESGSTTSNISIIYKGSPVMTHEWRILWNVPCCLWSVDTVYMGTGGGSIGWIDKGGLLNVGPRSQGAVPGPACYGQGGEEPTLTDAHLILGRLNPNYFLGGAMKIYPELARKAMKKIAEYYGWTVEEAAANMVMIATNNLMLGIRLQLVARGLDPRDFAMVAYGGGGPFYACDLSREMGISTVIIPPWPGYASAFGSIRVDLKHVFTHPMHVTERTVDYDRLNKNFEELMERARRVLSMEGVEEEKIIMRRYLDVKYFSQSRFLTVEAPPGEIRDFKGITERFLQAMQAEYGYTIPPFYDEVEIVNLRVEAIGLIQKPELKKDEVKGDLKRAIKETRKVWFKGVGFVDTTIYERDNLPTGIEFKGPAIIEQEDATTVIPPGAKAKRDLYGNIIVHVGVR
jgi:N-methylhydantoinase A